MTSETRTSTATAASSRRGVRVTTGCLTCRQRRVKCDESRPKCTNCGKKNRTCRYGNPGQTKKPVATNSPSVARSDEGSAWSPEVDRTPVRDSFGDVLCEPRPISPAYIDSQVAVSPSLWTTLGAILVDADFAHDTLNTTQVPPAPPEPLSDLPLFSLENSEELRVNYQLQLSNAEIQVFRNYVENVSSWIDCFSHDKPFHRQVPVLALRCPCLLHSCLALSAKQLNQVGSGPEYGIQEGDAVRYYRLALSAIRGHLLHQTAAQSDEVLAACIILSTYEMIDVVGESLGSHLTGVASLLQTRGVFGDVTGIRGSCYWTWYRHELWAAIRTGRCLSLDEIYWRPQLVGSFDHLTLEEIANRVIFLFGQCINFCNGEQGIAQYSADEWLRDRNGKAAKLEQALDDWKAKLPLSMTSLALEPEPKSPQTMNVGDFGAIWFVYPQSAVANQVYHASKITLYLHRTHKAPLSSRLTRFLSIRKSIEIHRREIFLTANAGIPDAWGLVSSQCLYIAGLVTEGAQERQRTLELIDKCQRDTGRKTGFLSDDLLRRWKDDSTDAN